MRRETIGYIENVRVVADLGAPEHWLVKGDVYFTGESVDEALRGFSFSYTQLIAGTAGDCELYLPYPHYNDQTLIRQLLAGDQSLLVGKVVRKEVTPSEVAIGVLLFLLGPAWQQVWDARVKPALARLRDRLHQLTERGVSTDLVFQVEGPTGVPYQAQFIPDRSCPERCQTDVALSEGHQRLREYVRSDDTAKRKALRRVTLHFDARRDEYRVHHVEYADGSDLNVA